MKGIEKLNLTPDQIDRVEASVLNYRRFGRIHFQVQSFDEKEAVIKVWQTENESGIYLSIKDLVNRTNEIFAGILPADVQIHCRPIPYRPDHLKKFTIADVNRKIDELGLKTKDLVRLLDIDKSSLSLILSGNRELNKDTRAMFYYLFKFLENEKTGN